MGLAAEELDVDAIRSDVLDSEAGGGTIDGSSQLRV
jgi:hypothetical protein